MQSFKNKLYNFETPPPSQIWQHISQDLQNEKAVGIPGNIKSKNIYYLAVAAASLVIIFIGSTIFKSYQKDLHQTAKVSEAGKPVSAEKMKDSIILNQKILESIIHSPKEKQAIVSNDLKATNISKKYITIAGPEGQPVRISPKVATLIISADNEFPPKPTWSKKIDRWQKIMLSTTFSSTSAGLADLIQLASQSDKME